MSKYLSISTGRKCTDLTGHLFARLAVIKFAGFKKVGTRRRPFWECRCECGTIRVVRENHLKDGTTRSCGCLRSGTAFRVRILADKSDNQHVYFIQCVNGGPVKIGISKDIDQRLAALQVAFPYRLIIVATIKQGGRKTEAELHERFAGSRLNGEWFEMTPKLKELINETSN